MGRGLAKTSSARQSGLVTASKDRERDVALFGDTGYTETARMPEDLRGAVTATTRGLL